MSDRIEAIRKRYSAEDGWFYHDIAVLLAEVDRMTAIESGAWALVHRFERWPSSPSLAVAARHLRDVLAPGTPEDRLRAALAPVAPDAEPGGAS